MNEITYKKRNFRCKTKGIRDSVVEKWEKSKNRIDLEKRCGFEEINCRLEISFRYGF